MTMMNDDDDVKIVSDVLDDVQSKEKTKRKNVSLLLDCSLFEFARPLLSRLYVKLT